MGREWFQSLDKYAEWARGRNTGSVETLFGGSNHRPRAELQQTC